MCSIWRKSLSASANDGYAICKGLRKLGIDSDLIIERPSHVASLPQWEDGDVEMERLGDPYNPNWDAFNWLAPEWIRVWDDRKSWYPYSRTLRWSNLLLMLRHYDLVIGHAPFAKIAQLYGTLYRKPFIIFDAGWIRYLPQNKRGYANARKGYRQAADILYTNVDTESMFDEQGYQRTTYTPFAIDTEKYAPSKSIPPNVPTFFHPSRHDWIEKGNDRLIRAFAKYVKRNPNARLITVEWYQSKEDLDASKRLISELDVQNNVTWVPVMPKNKLVEHYQKCTAVFDQFAFGAFGTTAPEAMSCGKPVVGYMEPRYWQKHHAQSPPVLNASTTDEIYDAMVELEDPQVREDHGTQGREWIMKNCDFALVASRQLEIYDKVLEQ
jgi:glycosyltransferase involved in cell wall biosynthesis